MAPEPGAEWTEAGERAVQDEFPALIPLPSTLGEGVFRDLNQRKCDMWQGTPTLGRFSFCPDW